MSGPRASQLEHAQWIYRWSLEQLPFLLPYDDPPRRCIPDLRWDRLEVDSELPEFADKVLNALRDSLGDRIEEYLADYLCCPFLERWDQTKRDKRVVNDDMLRIVQHCVARQPGEYTGRALIERLKGLLTRSWPIETEPGPRSVFVEVEYGYLYPAIDGLSQMLCHRVNPDSYWEELKPLLMGEWNTTFEWVDGYRQILHSYNIETYRLRGLIAKHLATAIDRNEPFEYEDYLRLAKFSMRVVSEWGSKDGPLESARKLLDTYRLRHLTELYDSYDPREEGKLVPGKDTADELPEKQLDEYTRYREYPGIRWLLKTCEHIERYDLTARDVNEEYGSDRTLTRLACVHRFEDGESERELARLLAGFSAKTLWLVFPFAGYGQKAVLQALKAGQITGLHEFFMQFLDGRPYVPNSRFNTIDNSTSEEEGVLDLQGFLAVVEPIPDRHVKAYFKSLNGSKIGYTRGIYLCEAALGWNRARLLKALKAHGQIALKSLGLLPLESADEARERYLTLRRAWKECSKYGAERQANTRAAVAVGLKNLAQRAGYRDVARMEWDLEAQLGDEAQSILGDKPMGDWTVRVAMEGLKTRLQVAKGGKLLKSVPAGLRKHPDYAVLREHMKTLDEQARRFRGALEKMMCDDEAVSPEELKKLGGIAAVGFLLSNLIGIDAAGNMGLIDASQAQLVKGGLRTPIEGELCIAHVNDLFVNNCLSDWQAHTVTEGMVQPFKQTFRELYLLTPAERETSPESRRFSGRSIRTAVVYRLLQGRDWSFGGLDDDCQCWKNFPGTGVSVCWRFPQVHHFFVEEELQVSGDLYFRRDGELLPLDQVPPLIFSEAMRDADLAVSVGVDESEGEVAVWSPEVAASREALIRELATKLGLKGVEVEGRFVYVQGKLARYRIHLGSANIHIMPGAYLCIIPAESKGNKSFYLPFADQDRMTTEIISKIFLLLDDDAITDPGIRGQIESRMGAETQA